MLVKLRMFLLWPDTAGAVNCLLVMADVMFDCTVFIISSRHSLIVWRACINSSLVPSKRIFIPVLVDNEDKNRPSWTDSAPLFIDFSMQISLFAIVSISRWTSISWTRLSALRVRCTWKSSSGDKSSSFLLSYPSNSLIWSSLSCKALRALSSSKGRASLKLMRQAMKLWKFAKYRWIRFKVFAWLMTEILPSDILSIAVSRLCLS